MYRALLGGVIAVLLVAGVTAAILVDPSDEEAGSPPPTAIGSNEASRALCAEIDASMQTVAEGRGIEGGLRLSRALNTYERTADPAIVEPTRRLLATAVRGDLEGTAVAAREASSACARTR